MARLWPNLNLILPLPDDHHDYDDDGDDDNGRNSNDDPVEQAVVSAGSGHVSVVTVLEDAVFATSIPHITTFT